ncbi:DUF402 domain-containing protein [Kitasatospora sp. NPDC097605]|uniref:DUF402 domain-containing protein n=1 Tax=Kitasatospora sp. NPDC097605 TaxID=3157226 RepID=UPI00332A8050
MTNTSPDPASAPVSRFAPGTTAVLRDIARGRIWSATPLYVLADTGATLTLAARPGIEKLAPTTWITSLRTGDPTARRRGIENLVAGRWELAPWTWRDTVVLSDFTSDEYFSVHRFLDPDGRPLRWYVNFERPYRRTAIGIDTFDLFVDLVVDPDLSAHRWKDEDEYDQARRLGLVDDTLHRLVERARERALALLEDRAGPFASGIDAWAAPPVFPLPVLPPDVLTVPVGVAGR